MHSIKAKDVIDDPKITLAKVVKKDMSIKDVTKSTILNSDRMTEKNTLVLINLLKIHIRPKKKK